MNATAGWILAMAGASAAVGPGVAIAAAAWKLTVGEYSYGDYSGTDLNLRWRGDDASVWLGGYTDPKFGNQERAGADKAFQLGQYVQLQPSLQAASRGFVGGSINVQAGLSWYGIAGFGRTDARPYFNLNFDPNDAVTLGAGHQSADGAGYMVFVVADDRFHTGQRDWHANVTIHAGDSHATLDLLRKSGLSDAGPVRGWGFSATWDWPAWFLRAAYDPHQNFSAQNAWRLATGCRF